MFTQTAFVWERIAETDMPQRRKFVDSGPKRMFFACLLGRDSWKRFGNRTDQPAVGTGPLRWLSLSTLVGVDPAWGRPVLQLKQRYRCVPWRVFSLESRRKTSNYITQNVMKIGYHWRAWPGTWSAWPS